MPTADADAVSLVAELCDYIRSNLESPLALAELDRLKERLKEGCNVTTAMTAAARLGMTPGQYRAGGSRNGEPVAIRFTTAECPVGRVILATTEKGVCWLSFGDADGRMEAALRAEFPKASVARDDRALSAWMAELQRHFAGDQPHIDLSLDVRATAFQRRVWEALRAIPYGETRSYKQVAEAIGAPKAVRAVARACATNPVAVVVPCHRVIGTDGKLHGYAGGLHRKKRLLEKEAGINHKGTKRK